MEGGGRFYTDGFVDFQLPLSAFPNIEGIVAEYPEPAPLPSRAKFASGALQNHDTSQIHLPHPWNVGLWEPNKGGGVQIIAFSSAGLQAPIPLLVRRGS